MSTTPNTQPLWFQDAWKKINLYIKLGDEAFEGLAPQAPGTWLARKYRYADGRVHRDAAYVLFYADPHDGHVEVVGGAVCLAGGEVCVYLGDTNPAERFNLIFDSAYVILMGKNLKETLDLMKSYHPNPIPVIERHRDRRAIQELAVA